ncbi:hypothetical protein [Tritonibacter sp. SIMBA_163]|uniref:hypothetical protein n=1 Tax=Tritonibacter sp. SIMBA_163 TaxID=3080868 RepID=UPI00398131FE
MIGASSAFVTVELRIFHNATSSPLASFSQAREGKGEFAFAPYFANRKARRACTPV